MHDTQYRNGFQTGGFGGDKNVVRRTNWENELWQFAYTLGDCIDGSQSPKYAGLNVIPQAGGLDDPPGEFAFGDCYLQLKQHMLKRAIFCLGDSGVSLAMKLPIQLAIIDTISVALQNPDSNMNNVDLCKLVIALTGESESACLEYQIEAQVHSSIQFSDDIESLHMPITYQEAYPVFRRNKAQQLADKYGWDLRYYSTNGWEGYLHWTLDPQFKVKKLVVEPCFLSITCTILIYWNLFVLSALQAMIVFTHSCKSEQWLFCIG